MTKMKNGKVEKIKKKEVKKKKRKKKKINIVMKF
jgi:hypothetical protein